MNNVKDFKSRNFYGKIQALRGVDTDNDGEIVSLINLNGAGKSTLLMTISGVNKARNGKITFKGENIVKDPHKIVDLVFAKFLREEALRLTVEENFRLGATQMNRVNILTQISKQL